MSHFERGNGGYSFSDAEIIELSALRDEFLQVYNDDNLGKYEVGLAAPLYQKILEFISENGQPKAGVDPMVWAWIEGAVDINSQNGFFADFIHEYTKVQYEIRGGDPSQFGGAANLGQLASNNIGLALINDILNPEHENLPGVSGLGAIDAGSAASAVFAGLPGHGDGDYVGWAGTLLFPYLGYDRFFTEWIIEDEIVSGTIEGEGAKTFKHSLGTYDIVAMMQASIEAAAYASVNNLFGAFKTAVFGVEDHLDGDQTDIVADLDSFFRDYYALTGEYSFAPSADLLFDVNALPWVDFLWDAGTHLDDAFYLEDGYLRENILQSYIVNAGDGDDFILGGAIGDLLDGDQGDDIIVAGEGKDILFGNAGQDLLAAGFKPGSISNHPGSADTPSGRTGQNFLDSLQETQYFGDEDQDILNGGADKDTYYLFASQSLQLDSTDWSSPSIFGGPTHASSFFDVITTSLASEASWRIFDSSILAGLDQTLDTIRDEDGTGQIFVGHTINNGSGSNPYTLTEFSNQAYVAKTIGTDTVYEGDLGLVYLDDATSKLYGFSFTTETEYGSEIRAHWTGYHAQFVIEDFEWGDFGITIGTGDGGQGGGGQGGGGQGDGGQGGGGQGGGGQGDGGDAGDGGGSGGSGDSGGSGGSGDGSGTGGGGSSSGGSGGGGGGGTGSPSWHDPNSRFYRTPTDPLVLDLDGNGIELITFAASGAYFDLDNDGFAENTAWVAPTDGFLALDSDGSGTIDQLSELFGTSDIDGFTMLGEHDENGDGVINAQDAVFADLKIWRDLNGDGLTDPGELVSASSMGLEEIRLDANYVNQWQDGNWISHEGTYTINGETRTISNVWFDHGQVNSIYAYGEETDYSVDITVLPNLKGYGDVKSLHAAMHERPDLLLDVKDLVETSQGLSYAQLAAKIEAVLLKWAEVDLSADRGPLIDGSHLEFMEAIHGIAYGTAEDPNPLRSRDGLALEEYYAGIMSSLVLKVIVQLSIASYILQVQADPQATEFDFVAPEFSDLRYDDEADTILGDLSSVAEEFAGLITGAADSRATYDLLLDLALVANSSSLETGTNQTDAFAAILADNGVNADLVDQFRAFVDLGYNLGSVTAAVSSSGEELTGPYGPDLLLGSEGADTLIGEEGSDYLIGRGGDDVLRGGRESDTYVYRRGDGHDTIEESTTDGNLDTLTLIDLNQEDVTLVRDGHDVTLVIAESSPGAGDNGSILLKGSLRTYYGLGVEQVEFADGTVWTQLDMRNLFLDSSSADEDLVGFNGSDTFVYERGDGHDTITESTNHGNDDTLSFTDINPADVTLSRDGSDLILTIAESSPGAGDDGSVRLISSLNDFYGLGVEKVAFADGTIWTRRDMQVMLLDEVSTPGNDVIQGTANADLLSGGLGDDELSGGDGNDTYVYRRGDGSDTIKEAVTHGNDDTLSFVDIASTEVSLVRETGEHVSLIIAESSPGAGDGGSVLLENSLEGSYELGVENITFSDGVVWTQADLRAQLLEMVATDGDDTIVGFDASDTISGGLGDDNLQGGNWSDTYLYSRGDGHDTITEVRAGNGTDTLRLENILPADIALERTGNDVRIVIPESTEGAGDGGSITLRENLDEDFGEGIEQIIFADETVWSRADLRVKLIEASQTDGDDTVSGFNVGDTLEGGLGNDTLNGADGDDIYIYARGDGHDTILEASFAGYNDTLSFTDVNADEIRLRRDGNDLTVVVTESTPGAGDSGSVRLVDFYDNFFGRGLDKIEFADGTVWDRQDADNALVNQANTAPIVANSILDQSIDEDTAWSFSVPGDAFADTEQDLLTYTATLADGSALPSWLTFDAATRIFSGTPPQDFNGTLSLKVTAFDGVASADDAFDLVINPVNDAPSIAFAIGEQAVGETQGWSFTVPANAFTDPDGDTLTYSAELADGSALPSWLSFNAATRTFFGTPPQGSLGTLSLLIIASDGVVSTSSAFDLVIEETPVLTVDIAGTGADETLNGTSASEIIAGFGGNDAINGGDGNDTYIYNFGDGNDTITETYNHGNADRLELGAGILASEVTLERSTSDTEDITLHFANGGSITLDEQFYTSYGRQEAGVEEIAFADGTVWSHDDLKQLSLERNSTDGDDTLLGYSGQDSFDTGLGNDTVNGGAGNDIFIYNFGDGNDTITETYNHGNADRLELGAGILASEVMLERSTSDTEDITLHFIDGGSITLDEQFYTSYGRQEAGVEEIAFADGTVWYHDDLKQLSLEQNSTDGDDTLLGYSGQDSFDTGLGNDTVNGGAGNDIFIYNFGDGNDTITETYNHGNADRLELGAGILASEVTFERSTSDTDDITLHFIDGGSITLDEQFYTSFGRQEAGVEEIAFADGTVWSHDDLKQLSLERNSTDGDDTLLGYSGQDSFDTGLGNDTVNGGAGNDIFIYNFGDGNDTITETYNHGDADRLELGVGILASEVTLERSTSDTDDITLHFIDGGSITLDEQFYSSFGRQQAGVEEIVFADGTIWGHSDLLV